MRTFTSHLWRCAVAASAITITALVGASAAVAAPTIQNLAPSNGATLPYGTDLNQGPLQFTCPTYTSTSSGQVSPLNYDYRWRVTTQPTLGPDGLLAFGFAVDTNVGASTSPTDCRNSGAPHVLPLGTYYWQASADDCDFPSCNNPGPVWSFTVAPPPLTTKATGLRAAALARCNRKHGKARKKCKRKARRLPY